MRHAQSAGHSDGVTEGTTEGFRGVFLGSDGLKKQIRSWPERKGLERGKHPK